MANQKEQEKSTLLQPAAEDSFTLAQGGPFPLASGGSLRPLILRYALYGTLNQARDNAILVCHALSGSARVADWWPGVVGPGCAIDTERYCIIGINVIGSCYGSTGPASQNAETGKPYGGRFPLVTIRDMVRAQAELLRDKLGIEHLHTVIGGSLGGMQALQWAVDYPDAVERCIAIGATPLSAMGLALNHLQRQAILCDPAWNGGEYASDGGPAAGLSLARGIAMCSYKSAELFDERFARRPNQRGSEDPHRSLGERFDVAGYLDYQGKIFVDRFDANTYLALSKAMDTFDFHIGYGSEEAAFQRIRARVLLLGISSDWLFPPNDVCKLSDRMASAGVSVRYLELHSGHGHDAFLAELDSVRAIIAPEIETPIGRNAPTPEFLRMISHLKSSRDGDGV
ncbi:MAG TPA: homoserine O-acetyltransferase [Terriglobales bacterium]|nr:homoserine O-acetyltransferase [Terriglobales bacterium]